MRKVVKVVGIVLVLFLAVGLILPSVVAYKPGSQVGADQDRIQGDPDITGPGETNEEKNEDGGGANNHEQNSEGPGLGERSGF